MRILPAPLLRGDVAPNVATRVRALATVLVATFALAAAVLVAGPGSVGTDAAGEQLALIATMALAAALAAARPLLIAENRLPYLLQAAGILSYCLGFVAWYTGLGQVVASLLWAAFYPLVYTGRALLIRSWARDIRSPALLDGVIAGCGAAALVAALFLPPIRDFATDGTSVLLAYSYPLVDVILLATVLVGAAVARAVPDRAWVLAGLCFAALLVGDMRDLVYLDERPGGLAYPSVSALCWMAAMVLLALAAWQPQRTVRLEARDWLGWSTLVVPASVVTSSIVLLLLLDITERPVVTSLAAATVAAAVVRTLLMYGELRRVTATNRIAMTDDLTGLATPRGLAQRLGDALAAGRADEPLAVVIVDLDGFGAVTGALGSRAGDEVLRQVAERIASVEGPPGGGTPLAARLEADEFAVAVRGADAGAAVALAERLRTRIAAPMTVADVALELDAQAGVAVAPEHGTEPTALIRHAAAAMEEARRRKEPVLVYDPELDAGAHARLTLLGELRQALASGQIVAHFQPQVDPFTGEVRGVEALVRWQHPEKGLVPPVAFLDVAQRSGLMRVLTERVLALALERAAAWRAAGTPVGVSVNVAAPNLLDREFPAHVADALRAAGLPPGALTLEITEDVVMAESEQAIDDLHRLRDLGVRLSLDDFGTGHSSLAKLKRLPIHELKIDRSFVSRLTEDRDDLAIVETTVRLARSLGLSVVAEGVEDGAVWTMLAELGCDALQGFGIARPLAPDAIDAWLAQAPVPTPLPGALRRPGADAGAARLRAGSARPPR